MLLLLSLKVLLLLLLLLRGETLGGVLFLLLRHQERGLALANFRLRRLARHVHHPEVAIVADASLPDVPLLGVPGRDQIGGGGGSLNFDQKTIKIFVLHHMWFISPSHLLRRQTQGQSRALNQQYQS